MLIKNVQDMEREVEEIKQEIIEKEKEKYKRIRSAASGIQLN